MGSVPSNAAFNATAAVFSHFPGRRQINIQQALNHINSDSADKATKALLNTMLTNNDPTIALYREDSVFTLEEVEMAYDRIKTIEGWVESGFQLTE